MTVGNNTAPDRPTLAVGETVNFAADMRGVLDDGELVSSVTSVEEVTTTDLTIANAAVNSVAVIINGLTVPIGKAVQFNVLGQELDTDYILKMTFTTDSTPSQVRVKYVKFLTEGP